jgi:hypothetical protein
MMDFGVTSDAELTPVGELAATGAAAIADIAAADGCSRDVGIVGPSGLVASARVLSLPAAAVVMIGSKVGAAMLESGAAVPDTAWELGAEDGASVAGGCCASTVAIRVGGAAGLGEAAVSGCLLPKA